MKKIKINTCLIILLSLFPTLYGQQDSTIETEMWNKHIYEIGEELTSCECNFRNLFQNWGSLFVNNPEVIELLSYKYVEAIEHDLSLDYYASLILSYKSIGSGYHNSVSMKHDILSGDTVIVKRNIYIYPNSTKDEINGTSDSLKVAAVLDNQKLLRIIQNNFKRKVHIGDKVFLIKMLICGELYNHYVICRPEDNSVVWDDIFGYDIPLKLRYYKYKNNNNFHLSF